MKITCLSLLALLPYLLAAQCNGVEFTGLPAQSCQWQELTPMAIFPKNYPQKVDIQWTVSGGEQIKKEDINKKQARITPTTFLGELTITLVVSPEGCIGKANTPTGPQIISRTIQIRPNPKIQAFPLSTCLVENCSYFNLYDALPESTRGNVTGFWKNRQEAELNDEKRKIKNPGNYASDTKLELFARLVFSDECTNIVPFTIDVLPAPAGLEDEFKLKQGEDLKEEMIAQKLALGKEMAISFHQTIGDAWNPQQTNALKDPAKASFITIKDLNNSCLSVLRIQNPR